MPVLASRFDLAPELALAIACCRRPEVPGNAIRAAAKRVDWGLFCRTVRRHRVDGLVWRALQGAGAPIPAAAASAISAGARRVALTNLGVIGESDRLRRLFDNAGIDLLFLKGTALGQLAYGDPFLKMGWDIDVLVRAAAVEEAAFLLERSGYGLVIPGRNARQRLAHWHQHHKESVWHQAERAMHVELHTAIADHPMLLARLEPFSNFQLVTVGCGVQLPTLTGDELFAYLCVHGASSAWFRLKWIADLAALLSATGPEEIDRLYRRSQELGAGRAAAQALLLCLQLFETQVSTELACELRADRFNRFLVGASLASLAGRTALAELHERRLGTLNIHVTQYVLLPGLRYVLGRMRRQLMDAGSRLVRTA